MWHTVPYNSTDGATIKALTAFPRALLPKSQPNPSESIEIAGGKPHGSVAVAEAQPQR